MKKIYKGTKLNEISFPLGGIGTGSVGLGGNGRLLDWEIFNIANKNSTLGFTHFAIKAERRGKVIDARVLQGDYTKFYLGQPGNGFGHGIANNTMAGFPHFEKCEFRGEFPLAQISLSDSSFPGKVRLTAFNPFIPLNADDSGIPAAFFEYEVTNDGDAAVDYVVASSVQNPRDKSVNIPVDGDGFTGVRLTSELNRDGDVDLRELTVAAADTKDVGRQEYWYRGMWYDAIETFWNNFTSPSLPEARRYDEPGRNDHASIYVRKHAKPGESVKFRFVISWSCPYFTNWWNPVKDEEKAAGIEEVMKDYYAYRFPTSVDSAKYALAEWDRLFAGTKAFHDALFSSTLPEQVVEIVSTTVSVLKTATVLRIGEKGDFYGWEGLSEHGGSCEGTCAHVWTYVYSTCFLFPELERNLRENDYKYNQADTGEVMFRTSIPFGRKPVTNRGCVDGQMGGVMKVYREWKISGDDGWLRSIWPDVKRSLEYAWLPEGHDKWDLDRDGVIEGRQHHTLDTELFGPNSWLEGFYLGALRAGSEIARYLGENESADEYDALFEKGKKWTDENLFNGEYYCQKLDLSDKALLEYYSKDNPDLLGGNTLDQYWNEENGQINYQIGEGCEIDQVLAQWHADVLGLGDLYDPKHLKSALRSVYKYNFKKSMRNEYNPYRVFCLNDEAGTTMCSFPRTRPLIPILTSKETMHGFELSFASLLISRGFIKEGLEVVSAVRDRYDGEKRNPWNEVECGSNYSRSMSSFSMLPIFSGMSFDMSRRHLGFAPIEGRSRFKCLWSLEGAWGMVTIDKSGAALDILGGSMTLRSLGLSGLRGKKIAVTADSKKVGAKVKGGEIVFDDPVVFSKKLRVSFGK